MTQEAYRALTAGDAFNLYLILFTGALLTVWVLVFRLGHLLTGILSHDVWRQHESRLDVSVLAGLWAFPALVTLAGVAEAFSAGFVVALAGAVLIAPLVLNAIRRRGASNPRPAASAKGRAPGPADSAKSRNPSPADSAKARVPSPADFALLSAERAFVRAACENSAVTVAALTIGALFAIVAWAHMAAWVDGNWAVAAGHLVRTGFYSAPHSDGQPGMVALGAVPGVFFPKMNALTSTLGWAPFFVPFLFIGLWVTLKELFLTGGEPVARSKSTRPARSQGTLADSDAISALLAPVAFTILALPLAFKAVEIRGSVAGFTLALWGLFFTLRYVRTENRIDGAGAVFAMAAAWNFGQLGALYAFLFLGLWSLGAFLSGRRDESLSIWRVLFWINVIEWPLLALSFRWSMGETAPLWRAFVPGTLTLALAGGVITLLRTVRPPTLGRVWLFAPVVLALGFAIWRNPDWSPVYNWYFFNEKVGFFRLNFSSFGLWGWVFLLALLLSLPVFLGVLREGPLARNRRAAGFMWLAFLVSCLLQWLSVEGLRSGEKWGLPERAYFWDIWKDANLYWINPFIVVGTAYLLVLVLNRLGHLGRPVQARVRLAWPVAIILLVIPLHGLELFQARDWTGVAARLSAKGIFPAFKGQQAYSIPGYLAFSLHESYQPGSREQRADCVLCSVHGHHWLGAIGPLVDHLTTTEIRPGETFVTGESILTSEVYVGREFRYDSGINTHSPIYVSYLDGVTGFEPFWKDRMRIRRNKYGMAYSLVEPEKNLIWLDLRADHEGRATATLKVPRSGRYELFRGWESAADPVAVRIDGVEVHPGDERHPPSFELEAGREYAVQLDTIDLRVPVVVYPWRDHALERVLLDNLGDERINIPTLTRATGMIPAPFTVEDLRRLMNPERRAEVIRKHRVRFILADSALKLMFPDWARLLGGDPALQRWDYGAVTLYEISP